MAADPTSARPWYRQLHGQVALAIVGALAFGLLARALGWHEVEALRSSAAWVGTLFLRLLRMLIVPLVFSTIVSAVARLPLADLGRLGARTFAFYTVTTCLAIVTGLVLVNWIEPGVGVTLGVAEPTLPTPPPVGDVLLGIVPDNPFASMAKTFDLLAVIFFGICLGAVTAASGSEGEAVERFFTAFSAVMLRMTKAIMALAPVGIFALVLQVTLDTGLEVFVAALRYVLTVALALSFHAVVTLPLLLFLFAGVSAIRLAHAMAPALLTAFSTASSAAALPVALDNIENRAGVERRTGAFVLPLGSTVNMDGTALYEAVAALFIAQAYGIDLSLGQQATVLMVALLAAVGAAGVPSAGLVMLVLVLESVGLPLEGIGLLLAVDRVLDMMRTTINVWGDCVTATVMASFEKTLDRAKLS